MHLLEILEEIFENLEKILKTECKPFYQPTEPFKVKLNLQNSLKITKLLFFRYLKSIKSSL